MTTKTNSGQRSRVASCNAIYFATALSLLLGMGCGYTRKPGPLETHPVIGKVTYQGKPAVGASVWFVPVGGSTDFQKAYPSGQVEDDGTFRLSTYSPLDGAPE